VRIRSIKPEFWTDKKVSTWDHFTRLFFIGLWSSADDHGRGSAETARLASELFPYDLNQNPSDTLARVAAGLATLSDASRITLYEVDGEVFYEVSNWSKHQRVDNAGKPRVPTPSEGLAISSRKSREIRGDLPLEQGAGNREQGKDQGTGDAPSSRRRFTPPTREELDLEASKIGLPAVQVDLFVNYYSAKGWKMGKTPMVSWPHALANWKTRWKSDRQAKGLQLAEPTQSQPEGDYSKMNKEQRKNYEDWLLKQAL
jgi:hypothetical protein